MYDIKELKRIPIADVARKYGIELKSGHGRLWGRLRDENTPSFSINLSKNLWYDFGSGKGGSAIDLVAEQEGISSKEAINKLAEMFHIKNREVTGWSPLTDSQYQEIGIEASMATLNFKFDLRVHTPQQLARWSSKYGIPVQDLAEKYPEDYDYLIKKVAGNYLNDLKNAYYCKLKFAAEKGIDEAKRDLYIKWAEKDADEINRKVYLFNRALKGSYSDIQHKVDVQKDMKELNKKHEIVLDM